jgi:hypothetical protein
MKVKNDLIKYIAKPTLKPLIIQRYKTTRRFAYMTGFSESLISRVVHGKRYIHTWHINLFDSLLNITPDQYDTYFERITDGNTESSCEYNTNTNIMRSSNIA